MEDRRDHKSDEEAHADNEEEARIEEFFRLLRGMRQAKKELRRVEIENSTAAATKRGGSLVGRQRQTPWTPAFEMEDFFAFRGEKRARTAPTEELRLPGLCGRREEKKKKNDDDDDRRTAQDEEGEMASAGVNLGLRLGL